MNDSEKDAVLVLQKMCDIKSTENTIVAETINTLYNLIKRQQAEIDRLNIEINIETVKSEAVREFAEKLKSMLSFGRYTSYEQIDNLVKEMGCNDG